LHHLCITCLRVHTLLRDQGAREALAHPAVQQQPGTTKITLCFSCRISCLLAARLRHPQCLLIAHRACRFDLDLSTKPYKVMRYHDKAVRSVAFHRTYPLFASGSDDATVQVFHGMVYQDLMTNPLVVPVRILTGHKVQNHSGVLDVCFHPHQPWLFTAGGDSQVCLHVDV
jgi:WD40 repeat protein